MNTTRYLYATHNVLYAIRCTLYAISFLRFVWSPSFSEEVNCVMCHEALTKEKVVHAALQMGCPTCHSAVDAKDMPHKITGKIAKGLSSEQPDLCYGCHDKAKFTGKTVHAAIGMGCTGCHNPHSSKNGKLLKSEPPDLCFNCHDKAEFSKNNVHMPVAGGMCLSCHKPHSSEYVSLLAKEPVNVCLECHPGLKKEPHVTNEGHPIGILKKKKKKIDDPARPGKEFYCGSCHNPHSSDSPKLFRYKTKSSFGICNHCHKDL